MQGFGGKFGVQKDRMDKSAASYADGGKQQVGTNYTKTKPVIEGAKPSNLRAKFENLAKNSEDENRKRAEEQKRLREAKDKRDREEAAKKTVVENKPLPAAEEATKQPPAKGPRMGIVTGREGGIGNAISAFNQMQSPTKEEPPQRKEPIHIPREQAPPSTEPAVKAVVEVSKPEPVVQQKVVAPPPDLIPSIEIETVATPPEVQSPEPERQQQQPQINNDNKAINNVEEPLYQNNADIQQQQQQQEPVCKTPEPQQADKEATNTANSTAAAVTAANVEQNNKTDDTASEAIYANSENLADYIEDTHIHAIALYDYQAADDDEISFDPDDSITHIEMVSVIH